MGQMEKFLPPFPSPAHQQLYPSRPAGGNQRDKQPFNNTCTQAPNKPHCMHASVQHASLHACKRPTSLIVCTQAPNKPHCMHASAQQASLHVQQAPSHPHCIHNKCLSTLTGKQAPVLLRCMPNMRAAILTACTQAFSHPPCMLNKHPAILTASTQSLIHSHGSAQPSSLHAQQEPSHTQCITNRRPSILTACTTSAQSS